MWRLKLVPANTKIPFVKYRHIAVGLSVIIIVAATALMFTRGFNFGIDFTGGTLMEVQTDGVADLADMRSRLNNLGIGEVQLQRFGDDTHVLIRVGVQADQTEERGGQYVVDAIKGELGDEVEYRRVETVGPQVSGELIGSAALAVIIAVGAMFVYIWFRFEWQFALGAVLSIIHDVMATILIFSLFQLEFNLATIAALLTIVSYSINDTVVVFDRMRENLRKFKKMELAQLIDLSINETLARTIMTSVTTLLALVALFIFGGEALSVFTFSMIFGIIVGTYSSVYVAAPVLMAIGIKRDTWGGAPVAKDKAEGKA